MVYRVLLLLLGESGSNPGLHALWQDERQRRLDRQLPLDLEPPLSPGIISSTVIDIKA